jgi:hypothetical protein
MEKIVARIAASFLPFFFALVGAVLMAAGSDIRAEFHPQPSILPGIPDSSTSFYSLELSSNPLWFWCGCVILAASLAFLWSGRCKSN